MIDGARLTSPGIIQYALRAFRAFRNPIVTTLAWHLGPDIHRRAVAQHGYDRRMEDELLARIRWPEDGYRLFEIAALAGSSRDGWFAPTAESSSLFMSRSSLEALGGYDERFDQPGGGLVNMDTYARACALPDSELVMLLGEGTFHQIHGGVMTSATEDESQRKLAAWTAQYAAIRNTPPRAPQKYPHYIGHVPPPALWSILASAEAVIREQKPRTALLRKLKEEFRRLDSQPGRVIETINPILRGWVNYFRVGHASRCFAFVQEWVEKKVRRHMMRARGGGGFGWKRWK